MAQSLEQLYVEFASRGLPALKRDMERATSEADKARKKFADLKESLATASTKRKLGIEESAMRLVQLRQQLKNLGNNASLQQQNALQTKISAEEQLQLKLKKKDLSERKKGLNEILKERSALRTIEGTQAKATEAYEGQKKKIEGTAKGFKKLEAHAKNVQQSLNIGAVGFAGAVAGIRGLVAAADPTGFSYFQMELERLAMWAGRIFIPILRDVTNWVASVADWFKNLSAEQRQQYRDWARLGLKILGVVAALAVVGKIVGLVVSIFSGFISTLMSVGQALMMFYRVGVMALGAIRALITGLIGAVKALWAVMMANPLTAILAVITAAGSAIAFAFSRAKDSVEDTIASLDKANALIDRLEKGGRVTMKDVAEVLTPNEQQNFALLLNNKEKQLEFLKERLARAEKEAKENPNNEANVMGQSAAVAGYLRGEGRTKNDFFEGNRSESRFHGIRHNFKQALKEQGMGNEDAEKLAEQYTHEIFAKFQKTMRKDTLSDEDIEKVTAAIQNRAAQPTARLKFLRQAVKQGGIENTRDKEKKAEAKKENENDNPMQEPYRAHFSSLTDAWRQAQMAVQGDPKMKLEQERRDLQMQQNKKLEEQTEVLKQVRDRLNKLGLG